MYIAAIRGRMADSGQVLQDEMAMAQESRAFGANNPITPPRTGDKGGETHLGEYSLHFEMGLLPWGMGGDRLSLPRLLCFAPNPQPELYST
jgi:hypothetical protein